MRRIMAAASVLAVLGSVASSSADERSVSVKDVSVIQNGNGAARVLFRSQDLRTPADVAIWKATLKLSVSGAVEQRAFSVQVHPVTKTWIEGSVDWNSGWTRPGGDFDDELFARAKVDLPRGAGDVALDVTAIIKEQLEAGMFQDGLILTVAPSEGDGIRAADLSRFGNLATASLEVKYRRVSPRPTP